MAQGARNGRETAYPFKHPDELVERGPDDFGRRKPEAKRLNRLLEKDFFGDDVDKHAGELVKGKIGGQVLTGTMSGGFATEGGGSSISHCDLTITPSRLRSINSLHG